MPQPSYQFQPAKPPITPVPTLPPTWPHRHRRSRLGRLQRLLMRTRDLFRHRPLPALFALGLSLPVHMTTILSATFAGWAFRLPLPVFYYWVVVPVVALVGAIPISPQGLGVMEGFTVALTRGHGVSISQAFALTMSIRMVQVVWNLVAGVFVLRGGYHAPTEREQESLETDDAAVPDNGDAIDSAPIPERPLLNPESSRAPQS